MQKIPGFHGTVTETLTFWNTGAGFCPTVEDDTGWCVAEEREMVYRRDIKNSARGFV